MITSLNEYVNFEKIKDIVQDISDILEYENIYIIRNVNQPKVFKLDENNKLVEINKQVYRQSDLIKNYKYYFDNYEIQRSEIIKIEYENYNWIVIFICYTKNENYSVVSFSPDLNGNDVILKINTFLESKNFQIVKKKFGSKGFTSKFLSNLIQVFRNISGRHYRASDFPIIKKNFDKFKSENQEEWDIFEKWKIKNLGGKPKCIRFFDLRPDMNMLLTNNEYKKVKDLTPEDEFYYPVSKRYFSQWSLYNINKTKDEILSDLRGGIESSGYFGVISNIPTNKIVFSSYILMYGFSPHVTEREVIVSHDINEEFDKKIICKMA